MDKWHISAQVATYLFFSHQLIYFCICIYSAHVYISSDVHFLSDQQLRTPKYLIHCHIKRDWKIHKFCKLEQTSFCLKNVIKKLIKMLADLFSTEWLINNFITISALVNLRFSVWVVDAPRQWTLGSEPHPLTSSYAPYGAMSIGEQWLEVWHQLSSYLNHGGFPRTWYSGNHCSGRASQLRIGSHILATGIPEVHHHLISSGSGATPMHPCCPHSIASEWVDPGLMVSLFLGGFGSHSRWLSVAGRPTERGHELRLHDGMFCRLCFLCVSMFVSQCKGHKFPVMSSSEYFRVFESPLEPSICLNLKYINKQCLQTRPLEFIWERTWVCACRQAMIITFLSCILAGTHWLCKQHFLRILFLWLGLAWFFLHIFGLPKFEWFIYF